MSGEKDPLIRISDGRRDRRKLQEHIRADHLSEAKDIIRHLFGSFCASNFLRDGASGGLMTHTTRRAQSEPLHFTGFNH
jgi:hypothetical protein